MTDKQIITKSQMIMRIAELSAILQGKEQECERLRFPMQDTNYAILTKEEFEQLDQLKAENEELTTINARLLGRLEVDETDTSLVFNLDKELRQKEKEFYTAIQKVVKLKQTLTEIKTDILDIREGISYFWVIDKCDEILQKISEVEDG